MVFPVNKNCTIFCNILKTKEIKNRYMEKIARKLTDLVGNTPLLELSNYNKSNGLKARLIVKIESFNPRGQCKRPRGIGND